MHEAAGHYVASVFDVVHDGGGTTAMFASKAKFRFFSRTWNTHGAPDRTGADNGRAKIDRVTIDKDNTRLVSKLNAELRTKPRQFTFLHISLPDDAGHRNGFMGPEYLTAVRQTDRLLGSILSTIDARPALKRQLLVVLTADHGGNGASHAAAAALQNMRVPFMVWGPGVAAGRGLSSLNSTFRSAGDSRPTYTGKQPVRNGRHGQPGDRRTRPAVDSGIRVGHSPYVERLRPLTAGLCRTGGRARAARTGSAGSR